MRRVILDTDLAMGQPGSDIDDGFALALALAEPEISVELVTTVNGNTDVDTATRLSTELLDRLGRREIPLARGASAPLVRAAPASPGNAVRFHPRGTERGSPAGHAAVCLAEMVMAEPGELTVVAIGPLTNVALALRLEPRIAEAVAEIVVMGGAFLEHTNIASMPGEFNFWVDPDAASVVLDSGAPLRLVGLDVTRRVRLTRAHAEWLMDAGSGFARFAGACATDWLDHLERTVPGDLREQGSCALHDPLAVAVVTQPDLVDWRAAHVRVETASDRTRGVVVADLLTARDAPAANCHIASGVRGDRFVRHFLDRMASLS